VLARVPGETEAAKQKRLSMLNDFWSHSAQHALAREKEIEAADRDADLLQARLTTIPWTTLASLQPIAEDTSTIRAHSTTFIRAGLLAARIATLAGSGAADPLFRKASRGLAALNDESTDRRDRNLGNVWVAAEILSYDDTLRVTGALLGELLDFAAYAGTRSGPIRNGVTNADLNAAVAQLATAAKFVTLERNDVSVLGGTLTALAKEIASTVQQVKTYDIDHIALRSTTSTTFQARAKMYVSLDAGLLSADEVREVVPYFGVNLYARPVNKNAPLAGCWCALRRLALTLGVTAASVRQDGRINDLFNSHAVMLGLGARVTDYWRLTVGGLAVKYFPNGPLQPSQLTARPALASSLDLDVLGGLGAAASFLIPGLK
jgi:hypothetical protein